MHEQKNKPSTWRLVSMDDLPIPSSRELEEARQRWVIDGCGSLSALIGGDKARCMQSQEGVK